MIKKMKTIFALLLGLFFTVALYAADRRPTVTLSGNRNFEITIDGRRYSDNDNYINISNLRNGRHSIEVYEFRRGLFGRTRRLISSRDFLLRNNDISINIDRFGTIQLYEDQYGRGRNNGKNNNGFGNDDRNYNKGYGNDRDNDWNDRNNNGRGKDKDWNNSNRSRNKGY
jgi:hypothetical protein